MLKWAVTQKRQTPSAKCETSRPLVNGSVVRRRDSAPCKIVKRRESAARDKRRRSTTTARRKSAYCDEEKENQYTSTPIKSSEGEALKDIINLTPKERRLTLPKQEITDDLAYKEFADGRFKHKRKKRCLDPTHSSDSSKFFRPFETVDSHVRSLLVETNHKCDIKKTPHHEIKKLLPTTYAPTLPTYFMEYSPLNETNLLPPSICCSASKLKSSLDELYPPNKKARIEHVNDFLHQISHVAVVEESTDTIVETETKMSPLVQRLVDLRFNKNACDKRRDGINDSSFINELSLDQLVDAILDSSTESKSKEKETQQQVNLLPADDDSGFRSNSTENSHHIDSNYICKCTKTATKECSLNEKTVINLTETYNERCIDDFFARKRNSSSPVACSSQPKRQLLDNSNEHLNFTLKRQKCVRRRKNSSTDKVRKTVKVESANVKLPEVVESEISQEASKESVTVCESDMVSSLDSKATNNFRKTRRCLNFESPNSSLKQSAGFSASRGVIYLRIFAKGGELVLQGKKYCLIYFAHSVV